MKKIMTFFALALTHQALAEDITVDVDDYAIVNLDEYDSVVTYSLSECVGIAIKSPRTDNLPSSGFLGHVLYNTLVIDPLKTSLNSARSFINAAASSSYFQGRDTTKMIAYVTGGTYGAWRTSFRSSIVNIVKEKFPGIRVIVTGAQGRGDVRD